MQKPCRPRVSTARPTSAAFPANFLPERWLTNGPLSACVHLRRRTRSLGGRAGEVAAFALLFNAGQRFARGHQVSRPTSDHDWERESWRLRPRRVANAKDTHRRGCSNGPRHALIDNDSRRPSKTRVRRTSTNLSSGRQGRGRIHLMSRRQITFERVVRGHEPPNDPDDAALSTPGQRMAAVWEITCSALAWTHAAEPRLQRSVCRVERSRS